MESLVKEDSKQSKKSESKPVFTISYDNTGATSSYTEMRMGPTRRELWRRDAKLWIEAGGIELLNVIIAKWSGRMPRRAGVV